MSVRKTLSMSPPARWLRGLWPDRNALRRTTDRAEAALVAVVSVALAACVPIAAIEAGGLASASAIHRHGRQPASYQASAVLTTAATIQVPSRDIAAAIFTAPARWIAPDGAQRSGKISVSPGAEPGSRVAIRVTANGTLVGPPAQPWPASHVVLIEFLAAAATALLLLCLGATARSILDKRRIASWDADWRATGPRWSSRL
jgi:hypothetical protein